MLTSEFFEKAIKVFLAVAVKKTAVVELGGVIMANFFKCLRCTCCGNSLLSLPSRQLHTTPALHIPATWCFGSMAKRSTPRFTASWAASRCARRKAWPQKLYTQDYFQVGLFSARYPCCIYGAGQAPRAFRSCACSAER